MEQADPSTIPTDAQIIQRVRAGNIQAYGTLVERYERGILAMALATLRDTHAAQDMVQDIFMHCFIKLSNLRDGSRFSFWLMKVARRRAIRAARNLRQNHTRMRPVRDAEAPDERRLFEDEQLRLLERVRRLPKHEGLMIGLRYFDGHSVKTIAQMTGRPIGTVTKQLSRAIERLRAELLSETEPCQTRKLRLL